MNHEVSCYIDRLKVEIKNNIIFSYSKIILNCLILIFYDFDKMFLSPLCNIYFLPPPFETLELHLNLLDLFPLVSLHF